MRNVLTIISVLILNVAFAQVSDFKSIDFTIADNVAKLNNGKNLDNLPLLAHELTYKLDTDVEKFRAIYTWVSTNIKGDLTVSDKVLHKRKKHKNDSLSYTQWNNVYLKKAFKKLFKHKKTMCTGYAYLIKQLCFFANIDCEIINGYGRSFDANVESLELVNHSWNAVKLNNKWYLCDATWSSGYFLGAKFIQEYNDGYFLTDPVLFAKNHIPIDRSWFLNQKLEVKTFIAEPLVYAETFKHKIIPIQPNTLITEVEKNQTLTFQIKTLKPLKLEDLRLIYFKSLEIKDLKINTKLEKDHTITLTTQFNHRGLYDVHLAVKDDVFATFTIKVIKTNSAEKINQALVSN